MEKQKDIKGTLLVCLGAFVILILAVFMVWNLFTFGVFEDKLSTDFKERGYVQDDWIMIESIENDIAALLCYSPDQTDFTYGIYVAGDELSLGYFFRAVCQGMDTYIRDGVQQVVVEDLGMVLLSMNQAGIKKIVTDNGDETATVEVDTTKPFVVALPSNCGDITFYDAAGNVVEGLCYDKYIS